MVHLRLRGRMEPAQELPGYSWRTAEGIEVSVGVGEPGEIVVDWAEAPDESPDSWAQLERAVEFPNLIEVVERGVTSELHWRAHEILPPEGVLGGSAVFAFAISAVGWASARGPVPLDAHEARVAALRSRPEIARAADEVGRAMKVWSTDSVGAMTRLYRAGEELIGQLDRRPRVQDWGDLGERLGIGAAGGLGLHDSIQLARHVDTRWASKRLRDRRQVPMSPDACAETIRRLIAEAIRRELDAAG